jgi:hypothetical protein
MPGQVVVGVAAGGTFLAEKAHEVFRRVVYRVSYSAPWG